MLEGWLQRINGWTGGGAKNVTKRKRLRRVGKRKNKKLTLKVEICI